ncbi:MAG TPA: tetratricopeptide repeat protein [Gemmatimonadales bacterium]|nr:tetratricopeptide repeat protein [Gemmatimonadales bacterium]
MVKRAAGAARAACALIFLSAPPLLRAQLPVADSAFSKGDYAAARAGYERALARDSLNERALYRLAILDSWDGKLVRSLARFARLRRVDPRDPDIMVSHAQVLAWAGRTTASEALYDSVLARFPERADALAGRARTIAWSGNLDRAEQLWRAALEGHPDDPQLLIGLAQTLYWKGQPELAASYATRARALAPEDRTARDLERDLRAALRPEVATSVDGSTDSDMNDVITQEGTVTTSLSEAVRGTLRAGWRHATDPRLSGKSYGAGGVLIAALGHGAVARAGLGARHIEGALWTLPDSAFSRTTLTAEVGVGVHPARYATVAVGYSHTPFDETAGLMRRDLTIDAVDLSFDVSPGPGWSVSGGAGGAWFSDQNQRLSAVAAILGRLARGLQIGPFARIMGYRNNTGTGYFSPDRFSLIEARAVYVWQQRPWGVRADGGIGTQQVFKGAARQTEWHIGIALSRGWGANNELSLVGSITNSAAATTPGTVPTEAFRYRTLGLRFRQGL